MKRAFDFTLALLLLIPVAPAMLLLALWIRMDSPGAPFYRGVRVGLHGRRFRIFKFRTMVSNADRIGGPSTADNDPRITRVGRIIRRLKLDEFAQLLNVLAGDMSFVGPRPEVPCYVDLYTEEEKQILSVRPGITDWASLWNHDEGSLLAGATDPEKIYLEQIRPTKILLQLKYVRNRSFVTDLRILWDTAMLFFHKTTGADPSAPDRPVGRGTLLHV